MPPSQAHSPALHKLDLSDPEEFVTRVKTSQVDIEVASRPAQSCHGLSWSLSHFHSKGPDTVEVDSSRDTDFVFTQVPLSGGFETEFACGTRYDANNAGLMRPKNNAARFRFRESENSLFGVLASLEAVEGWFGRSVPDALRGLLDGAGGRTFHRARSTPGYLRQGLMAALTNTTPLRQQMVEACALQILGYQLETSAADAAPSLGARELRVAQEARLLLEMRPEAPPALSDLAGQLEISSGLLDRAYREAFGCSYHQSAHQLRLQGICDALMRGEPIKSVAHRFGYASVSNFTSAFRRRMGVPPRRWLDQQV